MNVYIGVFLSVLTSLVHANDCTIANMEAEKVRSQVIKSIININADYGSNTDFLLKQYEKLTVDLAATRKLSNISENILKHCLGKSRLIKEVYDITDKKTVFLTITARFLKNGAGKAFQEKYIVPNNTWTEVAKVVEEDILNKRKEIKLAIKSGVEKDLNKEREINKRLIAEKNEVEELRALLNKKKSIQEENKKLKSSIQTTKSAAMQPVIEKKQSIKSSYKEGNTTFFIKKNNLFCLSESAFDNQISLLAEGIMKYASNCYETAYDVDVIMINHGMFGKTKVKSVSQPTTMWITTESVGRR